MRRPRPPHFSAPRRPPGRRESTREARAARRLVQQPQRTGTILTFDPPLAAARPARRTSSGTRSSARSGGRALRQRDRTEHRGEAPDERFVGTGPSVVRLARRTIGWRRAWAFQERRRYGLRFSARGRVGQGRRLAAHAKVDVRRDDGPRSAVPRVRASSVSSGDGDRFSLAETAGRSVRQPKRSVLRASGSSG
jgi:hypothetical protein